MNTYFISKAAQIRESKKEKYKRLQKLIHDWAYVNPFEDYEKEIKKLRTVLDELIEKYELYNHIGDEVRRQEFNSILKEAKQLINY